MRTYDFMRDIQLQRNGELNSVLLKFSSYNETFNMQLQPSKIIAKDSVLEYQDGKTIPMLQYGYKSFNGFVFNNKSEEVGWARITLNSDLENHNIDGSFTAGDIMYHIREIERYRISKRSSDVEIASTFSRQSIDQNANIIIFSEGLSASGSTSNVSQCGSHVRRGIDSMKNSWVEIDRNALFGRGLNTTSAGCPQIKKELHMGIAADCSYIKAHGGIKNALTQIISTINIASELFEMQFNISLILLRVVFAEQCTPSDNVTRWNQECDVNCKSTPSD
jgi:hypothetical protein